MVEIIKLKDVREGDILLIDDLNDNDTCIVTAGKVDNDDMSIFMPETGFYYYPNNPNQIVRVGNFAHKDESRNLICYAENFTIFLHLNGSIVKSKIVETA